MGTIESVHNGTLNGPPPLFAPPPPPPFAPPPYPGTFIVAATPGNGVGVASGVLGIVGLVLSFIPVLDFVGVVLAILAVILGAVGIQRAGAAGGAGKGMAVTGLVCGLVALAVGLLFIAVIFSATSTALYT
jgi:hypothetical protein